MRAQDAVNDALARAQLAGHTIPAEFADTARILIAYVLDAVGVHWDDEVSRLPA